MIFFIKKVLFLVLISSIFLYNNIFAQDYLTQHKDSVAVIISLNGMVQVLPAGLNDWIKAQVNKGLFPRDTIKTLELSRAALLFVDHTQIKLHENTILEIKDIALGSETKISWGRTAKSLFALVCGEIWLHSGGEALDLQIDTPIASAAVRGTEFVIRADEEKTSVTVIEGQVSLKNQHGDIIINSGEQGFAEPDRPPYKTVVVNPEDAVQWSLYYPSNICLKDYSNISPDELRIIGDFFSLYKEHRLEEAVRFLEEDAEKQFKPSENINALLGFGKLVTGDIEGAEEHIMSALLINPDCSIAHSLFSNIYLVQNNKEEALKEAELAVKSNPMSPSAYISLSWARQSFFDIAGAVSSAEEAVELDENNIQALVTLCRLYFGSDEIKKAESLIDKALMIDAEESTVNATKGFLLLAQGRTEESMKFFNKSILSDSTQGLGHLGLGLAYIRLKRLSEGLREMLIATLLEPKISLYQSYMGKAYYQTAKEYAKWGIRKEEAVNYQKYLRLAEKTLLGASSLDPRDPTPHLYSGILLRDLNRPVEAIERFHKSIELNNNRAVYRSKFLLDKDRAVENVNLSLAYESLGLSRWGSYLAMRSVQSDFSASGAHRFLADTYFDLPGRTQAGLSELLLSRILMPVNENSFNTFNNYTSLFEIPEFHTKLITEFGDDNWRTYRAIPSGGAGDYAFTQTLSYYYDSGYIPENNDSERIAAYSFFKYALGMRSHIFASFAVLQRDEGSFANQWEPFVNDPDGRFSGEVYQPTLGYYYQLDPDTVLILFSKYSYTQHRIRDLSLTSDFFPREDKFKNHYKFWDGQAEVIKRFGNHQIIAGIDYYDGYWVTDVESRIGSLEIKFPHAKAPRRFNKVLIKDYWQVNDFLEFDIGLRYNKVVNGDTFFRDAVRLERINPQLGVLIKPFSRTTIRGGVFQSVHPFFEESIIPADVGGFVIDHNDRAASENIEYSAALDQEAGERMFFTVFGSYRERETPLINADPLEAVFKGCGIVLNRILNRRSAVSIEYNYLNIEDSFGRRNNHQLKGDLNFVHHSGWFAKITERYTYQDNGEFTIGEPFSSNFWTTDVSAGYELPKKWGRVTLSVENLFDKESRYVSDPINLDERIPVRRAVLKTEVYF